MTEVTCEVEKKPNCKIVLTVKAGSKLVEETYKKGIRKVAKDVSVPGFRKGKAPTDLIVKKFKPSVDEEWHKLLANQSFSLAQEEAKVPVLNNDSRIVFDMKSCKLGEGAEMTFSFESEPEVPEIKPEEIALEQPKREKVDTKKVDETIDRIRTFFGKWDYITDREALSGDHVRLDVDLMESENPERVIANQRFELKKGGIAKWMEDLVIGMKVGEQKEGVSEVDEDASAEDKKKFEPKKVRVSLNAIEICTLPELDDELAIKVGLKTIDEMRERVEMLFNKQADTETQRALRNQMSDYLINHVKFDLPETIIEEEFRHRLSAQNEAPQFRAMMAGLSDEEKKAKEQEIRKHSDEAIRLFYICRHIAGENGIKVSPADLNQDVELPLDAMFADPQMMDAANDPDKRAAAMSRILLNKAQDFLIEKAGTKPAKKAAAKPAAKKRSR